MVMKVGIESRSVAVEAGALTTRPARQQNHSYDDDDDNDDDDDKDENEYLNI